MSIAKWIKNLFVEEKKEEAPPLVPTQAQREQHTPQKLTIEDSFARIEELPLQTQVRITNLGNQLLGGILGKNTSNNKNDGRGRG